MPQGGPGQGVVNGGVFKRGGGGFPIWTFPFCPFLSLFVLSCPFLSFLDFPDFSGIFPIFSDIFSIGPFPLSWPITSIKRTYEEQSRKGPRHNPDLSRRALNPVFSNPVFEYDFWLRHVHLLRGVNKELCQASQHCSVIIAQVTLFTSDHHLVNLHNQILQGIGCPSSRV